MTVERARASIRFDVGLLHDHAELDGIVSTPPAAKRSLMSGISRTFTTSALSLSRTGCGVSLGASKAVQVEAFTSATPASCRVGQSGPNLDRLADATARTRTRPVLRCGATEELASMPSGISLAAIALAAGALPL